MDYQTEIAHFLPCCEQEKRDQQQMLMLIRQFGKQEILCRNCLTAHMTVSGFVLNPARSHTLMVYHNLYNSWCWTGGHADGETDFKAVALREALEETGVKASLINEHMASLDILAVSGHSRKDVYVPAHLHLSVAYLLTADDRQPLISKPDENSGVKWLPVHKLSEYCKEPFMLPIYQKLMNRMNP